MVRFNGTENNIRPRIRDMRGVHRGIYLDILT